MPLSDSCVKPRGGWSKFIEDSMRFVLSPVVARVSSLKTSC